MGLMQRRKGASKENELCRYLKEHGIDAKRNLGETRSENVGRDLIVDRPFCIQVKAGKRINWKGALDEAIRAANDDETPVAALKLDGYHWVAVLPLCDLVELIKKGG